MEMSDVMQRLQSAHQKAVMLDGIKVGGVVGFVTLLLAYSSAVLAAESAVGIDSHIRAIPLIASSILLALLAYLAQLAEKKVAQEIDELKACL